MGRLLVARLVNWWKWIRKDGWELVDLQGTDYCGSNWLWPISAEPYFIETWQNKKTGERRTVERR